MRRRMFHQRLCAIQQRLLVGESAPRQVQHSGNSNRNQRSKSDDRAGYPAVQIVRAHQRKPGQKRVHRVVPRQRRQNSPAQHHQPGDDSDQPHFNPANVGRLLRIVRVQETPRECRQHHRQHFGLGRSQQEVHGKQPEKKFLARSRIDSNRQRKHPRQRRAHRVGILQVLRRPHAKPPAYDVKQNHVADMRGRQANADHRGHEKFLAAQSRQRERAADAQPFRLVHPVERLARNVGDHHQQSQHRAHRCRTRDLA